MRLRWSLVPGPEPFRRMVSPPTDEVSFQAGKRLLRFADVAFGD